MRTTRVALPSLAGAGLLFLSTFGLFAAPAASQAQAQAFANTAFERTWQRTDLPVARKLVNRTWFWGPQPGASLQEPAGGLPGGTHLVQYFDKARMEINDPKANPNSPWYVTNGLLTVELVSGSAEAGGSSDRFSPGAPDIPLASDPDDASAPTYKSFTAVTDVPGNSGHAAASSVGKAATATIDRAGKVGADTAKASLGEPARYAHYEPATKHNIPGAFWEFLNKIDLVYEGGQTKLRLLSEPWFYATGYPISEAYWARVKIAGQPHDVLIQAFQRRVLTYVPDNPPGWRVQMGNIGQHYYQWRYGGQQPGPTPTSVAPITGASGRIAFVSDRNALGTKIYTMNPDGSEVRLAGNSDGFNYGPSFASSGPGITYVNIPPSAQSRQPLFPPMLDPAARIMFTDDSGKAVPVPLGATSVSQWEGQTDPARSPNGMFLAFRGKPAGEKAGLFVANLASDAPFIPVRRLTSGDWDRSPAWSPDGSTIAFTSGDSADTAQVWVIGADGTGRRSLTDAVPKQQDLDPTWSPDGKTIAFASNSATGKFEIMTTALGGQRSALTYAEGANLRHPTYSPDGRWLAFSSDKDGNSEIIVAAADGSRWNNITRAPSQDTEPSWGVGK